MNGFGGTYMSEPLTREAYEASESFGKLLCAVASAAVPRRRWRRRREKERKIIPKSKAYVAKVLDYAETKTIHLGEYNWTINGQPVVGETQMSIPLRIVGGRETSQIVIPFLSAQMKSLCQGRWTYLNEQDSSQQLLLDSEALLPEFNVIGEGARLLWPTNPQIRYATWWGRMLENWVDIEITSLTMTREIGNLTLSHFSDQAPTLVWED